MTIRNAIKKLSKYGTVQKNSVNEHWIEYKGYLISFFPNGSCDPDNNITCEHVRHINDTPDHQADYQGGSFFPNLTQAIDYVLRTTNKETR